MSFCDCNSYILSIVFGVSRKGVSYALSPYLHLSYYHTCEAVLFLNYLLVGQIKSNLS